MWIREEYVNQTERLRFGDTEYESFTNDIGILFKAFQKEYGRCISNVYIDKKDEPNNPLKVGWVFSKTMTYDDTHKPYVREVWITLMKEKPKVKTTLNYYELK